MAYQELNAGTVAYKVQSGLGSTASGGSGTVLRTTGGPGGHLRIGSVESQEVRNDGMSTRGRHGTQTTDGEYNLEYSVGHIDQILEAVMRGTWESALTTTQADFTSITTTTSTIVLTSGNPITLGFRVGDVIRLSGHSSTENNSVNLNIIALSATTITVNPAITANAVADTTVSIIRTGRKLINPVEGSLVKRYFTIDEYEENIDASRVFPDCVWSRVRIQMLPSRLLETTVSFVGTGQYSALATSSAPSLTSPTRPTGVPLAVRDGSVRYNSTVVADLTSLDLTIELPTVSPDIAFSDYAPDVFSGAMLVSFNMEFLRSDTLKFSDFSAETKLQFSLFADDGGSEPADFLKLYVGNFTIGDLDLDAFSKQAGPRKQRLIIPASNVGQDGGSGRDATMIKLQISNNS